MHPYHVVGQTFAGVKVMLMPVVSGTRRCGELRFYWRTNSCRCSNCLHSALLGQQLSAWVANYMAHILHIVFKSLIGIFPRIPGGYVDCWHTTSCFWSIDGGKIVLHMGERICSYWWESNKKKMSEKRHEEHMLPLVRQSTCCPHLKIKWITTNCIWNNGLHWELNSGSVHFNCERRNTTTAACHLKSRYNSPSILQ